MLATELLSLYDDTMRRNAQVAGCVREQTPQSSRYSTASGSLRYIMWHQFSAAETDRCIAEEIAAASGSVKALMWKVYGHDAPANLGERLVAHGFADHDASALMAAPVRQVITALGEATDAIIVRELCDAHALDAYQEIWDSVWPDAPNSRYVDDYRALANLRDAGVVFFAGFSPTDEPVTSGYLFHAPECPFALLCGGATKAAWRNQRAYTAMLIARSHCALERGASYLAVEASAQSQPILERLGFVRLSTLLFYEKKLG
jgi:hypothetical protein